jgi:cell filamentation protein
VQFEPGSRGRVLRNSRGITSVRAVQIAESRALEAVQEWLLERFDAEHCFSADDVRAMHRTWLGELYPWAGEYRNVNVSKGGFMFAAAAQIPRLMAEFERRDLKALTPCCGMDENALIVATARTHAELVLIHPFREGNGHFARLLAWLMALQAGLPPLDFWPLQGRGKAAYVAAIHAALAGNYEPMEAMFRSVIRRTWRSYARRRLA